MVAILLILLILEGCMMGYITDEIDEEIRITIDNADGACKVGIDVKTKDSITGGVWLL